MNYPIPKSPQEIVALRQRPVNEELIAAAIAGVIYVARLEGQSLADLKAQVLADDSLLDQATRRWLSDLVGHAWEHLTLPLVSDSCIKPHYPSAANSSYAA